MRFLDKKQKFYITDILLVAKKRKQIAYFFPVFSTWLIIYLSALGMDQLAKSFTVSLHFQTRKNLKNLRIKSFFCRTSTEVSKCISILGGTTWKKEKKTSYR